MYFLIDYENVLKSGFIGTHLLNRKDSLIIFFSEQCKTIDGKIFSEINKSKCKIAVRKLAKASPNALDFYIASEAGRIFGAGYAGEIAIVSKDNGFQAVVDYWATKEQGNRTVITGASIENCMLHSKIDETRPKIIKEERISISLETLGKNSPEESKTSLIKSLLQDTPFENCSDKIEDCVFSAVDKPSVYQNIVKEFGVDTGAAIYKYVKPLVKELTFSSEPQIA